MEQPLLLTPPPSSDIGAHAQPVIHLGAAKRGKPAREHRVLQSAEFDEPTSHATGLGSALDPRFFKRRALQRWVLLALAGLVTGLAAVAVSASVKGLLWFKFRAVSAAMGNNPHPAQFAQAYFVWLAWNVGCASLASGLTLVLEPMAIGSGISEIKTVLNGVILPRAVRLKTAIVKLAGVALTVAAGSLAGKEGPLISAGASFSAAISQGKHVPCARANKRSMCAGCAPQALRNAREKRDATAAGAAAGVAAAFGAPIGAVLFALEEGSSFWSRALTWRTFFCALIAAYTIQVGLSGLDSAGSTWGQVTVAGTFSFGAFTNMGKRSWTLLELPVFVGIGAVGGLVGAGFNAVNARIAALRGVGRPGKGRARLVQAAEVAAITACVITAYFWGSYWFGACHKVEPSDIAGSAVPRLPRTTSEPAGYFLQFNCPDGYYNSAATVLLNPMEDAIKALFHSGGETSLGLLNLVACWCMLLVGTCVTYGSSMPSGLFVPSLLAGSALGRALGEIVYGVRDELFEADPGTYALIGAASALGGMARLNISITVILVEATGNLQFALPIAVALTAARWVGNLFNEGLYDMYINMRGWPVLEEKTNNSMGLSLQARHVMAQPAQCLPAQVRVSVLLHVLHANEHQAFPVVTQLPNAGFLGTVSRRHLHILLSQRPWAKPGYIVPSAEFSKAWPRFPTMSELQQELTPADRDAMVQLLPYIDQGSYSAWPNMVLRRVYSLVRGLGLRHCPVVDAQGCVQGMITRHDLTEKRLHHVMHAVQGQPALAWADSSNSIA